MAARSIIGLFVLALAALSAPARAHDVWADGSAVPAWIKDACCGPEDVHRLGPDQVHRVDGGYRIDGYPYVIPESRLLPSQDGNWWAFYRGSDGGELSSVYCFFGPMGS